MGRGNSKAPAVFLDRDGTVIFDKNYLSSPEQLKLFSFSAESINKLRAAGFKIIIVTNQSGVARGIFTEKNLATINKKFISLLKAAGAKIDGLYYCPHVDSDKCSCRKPKVGMVLQGSKDFNIDLKKSYTVGDSIKDYLLGFNMGGKGILVLTGHGKKQQSKITDKEIKPMAVCKTLKQAAALIIKDAKKIKILLILLSIFYFVKKSYCSDDLKPEQVSAVSKKSVYVWKKRGKYRIPEHEKLKYTLLWNALPVGEATLELKGFVNVNERKAHYARLQYVIKSFFNSFYVIDGKIESLFDDESKASLKFLSKSVQNGKEKYEHIVFDTVNQTYEFKEDDLIKKGYTSKDVQDILTALCYVRTLSLKTSNRYNLNIQYGDRSYPLTIKVLSKEKIKTNIGEFNCFAIELLMSETAEIFLSNKMRIYITDDKKRMPALVKLDSQIGLVNAILESVDTNKTN